MTKKYEQKDEGLKLLVYGAPGSGKTWFAGSAAEDDRFGRVLMLETFGNPISLRNKERKPDILTLEELEDFNDPYEWLSDGQPANSAWARNLGLTPPYGTVIIDGATEVQRFIMRKISGTGVVGPGDLSTQLSRQGFGQLLGTMLNWSIHYFGLVSLGINVIITGLEANKQDDTMLIRNSPLFWGQSGNELCGYAYMVMRLSPKLRVDPELKADDEVFADSTYNVGQIVETKRSYAKDQYGCGVTHIINPTAAKVADLIGLSSQTKSTTESQGE